MSKHGDFHHEQDDALDGLLAEAAQTPPPPPGLTDRVMERLRAAENRPSLRRSRWIMTAAAAALLAALVGLPVLFPRDQDTLPGGFTPEDFDAVPAMRLSLLGMLPETGEALRRDGQSLLAYAKAFEHASLLLSAEREEDSSLPE